MNPNDELPVDGDFLHSVPLLCWSNTMGLSDAAHFSDRSAETEIAYNPVAFEALLSELQQYLGYGVSDASE